ncbi:Uma2 family endonuclease [Lamprobacter modestohalophilus]|uniref:Uma2 family endonuclease n=1 Tax=Lamprobacter modestohalophilus TaxID=1064514 RepID=UPI002ADEF0BE|nr:Uma2 family endonuclease [Lamprobacter modestohalophilus]MEA1048742.1 Uma2 family endonuclease [Lamprobacter modestohalophilus]
MNPLSHIDPDDPYPDSDGQPMADNTEQYQWLVKIKENLEILFADDPEVFVAGDLLWYPVPDRRETGPIAPDVFVVFGRPKGRRGSYRQWEEEGIAPQVAFEILSPSNSVKEMADKLDFYDRYGVEEYYVYDPDRHTLGIWMRQGGDRSASESTFEQTSRFESTPKPAPGSQGTRPSLTRQSHIHGWTSPLLGVRFALTPETLLLYYPNGQPFLTSVELARRADEASTRAEQETKRAEQAAMRAEQESMRAKQEAMRADAEHIRAERLAERLRALGVDPELP